MTTRDDLLASVEAARQEIIELCQALVRIPTVSTGIMPTGDELPAAELLRDKLAADGLDGDIFISAPNRGNYIATMRGSAGAPRLLYLSHTDVVPVEDEDAWTHPPFGAEIHEGRIYGRGSNDMKNTVAAEAMAMILLKRAGIQLRGDLIFAAGADEETGGVYGFEWLAKHHGDLLRADFGINEGGGALVHAPDGRLAYLVSTGEKGRLEIVITVKGRGFHASQPWRADNAIYKSQEVISRIAAYQPEIHVDRALIDPLADLYGVTEQITAENVDRIAAELDRQNPNWGSGLKALTRMTLVASMISAGVKSNSVAESATIKCDVRTLPHQDVNYVHDQLSRLLDGLEGVTFQINYTAVPSASPYEGAGAPFATAVQEATMAALDNEKLAFVPNLTVGFTDSRLIRHLCPVIYGFLPSHPSADPTKGGAHNINESADIESLILSTKMLVTLAYDVLGVN